MHCWEPSDCDGAVVLVVLGDPEVDEVDPEVGLKAPLDEPHDPLAVPIAVRAADRAPSTFC